MKFDVKGFGCDFAYTLDGGDLGELDYENFNGAFAARHEITGRSVHPGSAKNKMINAMPRRDGVRLPAAEAAKCRKTPRATKALRISSTCRATIEHAHLHYIIRDHDRTLF
jgi:tripeptide aminopeptidase